MLTRRLVLRREALADLAPEQLGAVVGAATRNCWGPTTLIPNHVLPPPAHSWQCPGTTGMC